MAHSLRSPVIHLKDDPIDIPVLNQLAEDRRIMGWVSSLLKTEKSFTTPMKYMLCLCMPTKAKGEMRHECYNDRLWTTNQTSDSHLWLGYVMFKLEVCEVGVC